MRKSRFALGGLANVLHLPLAKGTRRKKPCHQGQRCQRPGFRSDSFLRFESLEDRLMLAADDVISVGRTLSAWTTADIINNQLKITYSVFNQQAKEVDGVALTTLLQPGVQFVSSTVTAQQNGQQLSWDLGDLAAFGHVSVEVVVTFPGAMPLQIDGGASAIGMVDVTAVDDGANPIVLRTGAIDPALLASTVDANVNDPFIQATAAMYDQDPAQIFQFLAQHIGYESYSGSLRGSRGALWSEAGNSLDEASLGVALLRASGVPARYAHGTLSDPLAQELILSMFPEPLRITGFIPSGATVADPLNDPQLLAETREHYWVQFDAGSGFVNADTTFTDLTIGAAFTSVNDVFAEVPDVLRHKVEVRLVRELTTPAVGFLTGGSSQSLATVLTAVFTTAELVGRPITVGHFVETTTLPSPVFAATTHNYSPYLMIADESLDPSQDEVIRGTDYSEFLTSFPFGTQIVTGVFLEIDVRDLDGGVETYTSTIADRIGLAAREGSAQVSIDPGDQPLLTPVDLTTVNVLAAKQSAAAAVAQGLKLQEIIDEFEANLLAASQLPDGPERDALLAESTENFPRQLIAVARSRLSQIAATSDVTTEDFANSLLVKAYHDSPRIHVFQSHSQSDVVNGDTLKLVVDLLKNNIRAIVFPGQAVEASQGFLTNRGISDTIVESLALGAPVPDSPIIPAAGVADLFQAAQDQGLSFRLILPNDHGRIDLLDVPEFAKVLLHRAMDDGKIILAPTGMVLFRGEERFAWFEIDEETGESIGVFDDGSHGAFLEFAGQQVIAGNISQSEQFALGMLEGLVGEVTIIAFAKLLASVVLGELGSTGDPNLDFALAFKNNLLTMTKVYDAFVDLLFLPPAFALGFAAGVAIGYRIANDPPVDGYFISPAPLAELSNLPDEGNPFTVGIVPDPLYHILHNGTEVRSVFRLGIKNYTGTAQTYQIDLSGIAAGFEGETSVATITVPAGETAEVGVALRPVGTLPAPGGDASFQVSVTPIGDPGSVTIKQVPFIVPAIYGLSLTALPSALRTSVARPVTVELTVTSTGNVVQNVDFDAELAAGLSLSGLDDIVLNPGETVTRTVTLTPEPDRPVGSELGVNIVANFGAQLPSYLSIPLRVVDPLAESVALASVAARDSGNFDLSSRLDDLGIALTNLVQDPDDPIFRDQALNNLDSIVTQMVIDPDLDDFVGPLTAARTELETAATPTEVQDAIESISMALDGFALTIAAIGRHDVTVQLNPNSRVAVPLTPQAFDVVLHNVGSQTTTYDLSLGGVPPDVDSQLSQSSITLAPNEIRTITVTLTQTSATNLAAFGFTVEATFTDGIAITRSVPGSITPRNEAVSVVDVTVVPPFGDPGDLVSISTRLLNSVNQEQEALVTYRVLDSNGVEVIPPSTPEPVSLTVVTSLAFVELGTLDTSGLALGQYSIEVTVTDLLGSPLSGAVGTGTLLIGSPVSANIESTPESLPPGTSTITNSLEIGSTVPLVDPLRLVSGAAAGGASDAIRYGDYVYVATASGIQVLDIAGPNLLNPLIVGFVGPSTFKLQIHGDMLVAVRGGNSSRLDLYSLADPANPVALGTTGEIPYGSASSMVVTDTHVFIVNINTIFWLGSNDLFDHNGSVIAINIENPAAPFFDGDAITNRGTPQGRDGIDDGVLFNDNGTSNDGLKVIGGIDQSGGNQNTWDVKQVSPSILLVTGSSVTGTDTQTGVGLVRVIDISDPRNIRLLRDLEIPGTVHAFGLAIDGDTAFVTATEGGFSDFTANFPFTGRIVLATLDISDPADPQLIHTQKMEDPAAGVTFPLSLGNGLFSFGSNGPDGNSSTLYIVDASDPTQLAFSGVDAPNPRPTPGSAADGLIFVTDGNSLLIYDILGTPGLSITAEVQIPKNTGVTVIPNSFNIAPSNVIVGTEFDTYVFDLALGAQSESRTITWESVVTQLQPGETRDVTLTSTVHFTSSGSPGEIILPPQSVYAEQTLGITPASQTVQPGAAAEYSLSISNPSSLPVTYDLSVLGVPTEWVTLDPQVTVPAGTSVGIPLLLKANPFALLGEYGIVVNATKDGVTGSVQALLTLAGAPVLPTAALVAQGVFLELTPLQSTIGQGTSATYVVRVTNTGSQTDTFDLAALGLPAGFDVDFQQTSITVTPGASNSREVLLTITAPIGTAVDDYQFSVAATSTTDGAIADEVEASLSVLGLGVAVVFVPSSGGPGSVFQLMVTNTGQTIDTFELTIAGPAALAAALTTTQVTLNPGQSQLIPVQIGSVDFTFPGPLQLVGMAHSLTDPAVMDAAAANVVIAPFTGLDAFFDPAVVVLPAPAEITLPLFVDNLGNLEQTYSASVIATTGSVSASLIGLDDQPTQTIPSFILPGLSEGVFEVIANVTGFGISTITVGIFDADGELLTQVTATMNVPDPNAQGSISGLSYVDVNNNGAYAAPEHKILGAEILLWQDGVLVARTYSNINGEWQFSDLPAGVYTVQKVQPSLYFDGIDTSGSLGDQDAIANQFTITLPAATDATGYMFAERGLLPWYIGKSMYLASTPTDIWQNLDLRVTPLWYAFNPEDVQLEILINASGGSASVEVFDSQMVLLNGEVNSSLGSVHYQVSTNEMHYLRLSGTSPDADMSLQFTGLAGDYDGDGDVDGRDFLEWQRGFGSGPAATAGDGNGDGVVGPSDLTIWQDNYGQPTDGSPALVAELTNESGSVLPVESLEAELPPLEDSIDSNSRQDSTQAIRIPGVASHWLGLLEGRETLMHLANRFRNDAALHLQQAMLLQSRVWESWNPLEGRLDPSSEHYPSGIVSSAAVKHSMRQIVDKTSPEADAELDAAFEQHFINLPTKAKRGRGNLFRHWNATNNF